MSELGYAIRLAKHVPSNIASVCAGQGWSSQVMDMELFWEYD